MKTILKSQYLTIFTNPTIFKTQLYSKSTILIYNIYKTIRSKPLH